MSGAVERLLERLREKDIKLTVENDRLKVNAPKGALDDGIKAMLAEHRTALIEAVRASQPDRQGAGQGLRPMPRSGPLPASFAQQRFWFLDRMDPGRPDYNIGLQVRIRGALDESALRAALDELIERHESLRCRIVDRQGAPWLEPMTGVRAPFERIDLAHLEPSIREDETLQRAAADLRKPFDLGAGHVCRFLLVKLSDRDHLLGVSMHHAAADGWSIAIALNEVFASYGARVQGTHRTPPPLQVQYADYAAWERERFDPSRTDRHMEYWMKQLAGVPVLLELPTDRPRPITQSFRGERTSRTIDRALLDRIKGSARRHDATLFMWLMASFQVLLHRYSGQDDVVVGTPVANRAVPSLEPVIGCLINNVAIRGRLEENPPFGKFLSQIKAVTLDAFDHCELPFDLLVERLNPSRSASHAPVFQVLFTLHSYPTELAAPAGLTTEVLSSSTSASRFDLSLELMERDGSLQVMYEYATDLFDLSSIDRLHAAFVRLLSAAAGQPDQRVLALPLLSESDERLLTETWNTTRLDHDRTRCVHHLLERTAEASPDSIAVTDGVETLTYRALEERANRLAHLLQRFGARPDALVGVCVDRTVHMPIAIAAVLKAGAAYVPLDPTHPADRLRYTLGDAKVSAVVTLSRFAKLFEGLDVPQLHLDRLDAELGALPSTRPSSDCTADNLAYVIYTSGSTGRPKGVQVEHRNMVAFLEAMRREPGLDRRDTLLAVTTLSFDIAGLEMWLPLMVGARIVIASRTDVLDAARLMDLMREHGVTMLQATPATWRLLIEAGWSGDRRLRALCGGEALPRDLAVALQSKVAQLWNMYGPTETTVWSTLSLVDDPQQITIGHPIANTRVYVLGVDGVPSPIGVIGELCIGGEGVARGYFNRPELTAEKFATVTIGGRPERVYRTGDVARFRADGQLDFIGRRDGQVKVRGYRIELGEIEAALAESGAVQACVVAVREDVPGDQRLVGYVVTIDDEVFDGDSARAMLRQRLPEYMIPHMFVELPALPLTPNGKVDRKALPAPATSVQARRGESPVSDALLTPAQKQVMTVWREVLRQEHIGLHDNFFDVGGHSLLLVRLQTGLRESFDAEIPLVELFQSTTVAAQAERLSSPAGAGAALQRARARALKQIHG